MIGMVSLSVSSTHNPMSQDDKIDMEAEKVVESPPVLAASSSNAQMQDQNTPDAEQQLGLPSSFFKQFHSPEKKREDNAVACRTLVLWKPPAPAASDTTFGTQNLQICRVWLGRSCFLTWYCQTSSFF